MNQADQIFNDAISGLTRKVDFKVWPESIFFFKGDRWAFEYDITSGYLYCANLYSWDVLLPLFAGEYSQTQAFIKNKVEEHFKNKEVTPAPTTGNYQQAVEEHFKNKEVTPDFIEGDYAILVEEHFKNKEVTPQDVHAWRKSAVEEHFKNKEVTPFREGWPTQPPVEEHFKNKEVTPVDASPVAKSGVGEHFKNKEVTPRHGRASRLLEVEEHFKSKEITPKTAYQDAVSAVEEHFKNKEVTPSRFAINGIPGIEEHFKNKEITPKETHFAFGLTAEEYFKTKSSQGCGTLLNLMPIGVLYENDRPHRTHIPSLYFSNGEYHYYYRGVYIKHELFDKLKNNTITFKEWAKESNEEVKSAVLAYLEEVHGAYALYRFISNKLKEVETFVHKKDKKFLKGTFGGINVGVYTLYKGVIKGVTVEEKDRVELAYVRCYDYSTDRMFFLGVDAAHNNAKDAIASLYKIPKKLADHIKYINRQGERFSTILTEKGKEIRKRMSRKEFADLTSISGDDYFRLMQYEY